MNALNINAEDVLVWESNKLWNLINTLKQNSELHIDAEDLEKVEHGIHLKAPIYYITQQWYEIYPSSKKVKIKGHGKYWLKDFMKEKEARDTLMRDIIIKNIDNEGVIKGRVE